MIPYLVWPPMMYQGKGVVPSLGGGFDEEVFDADVLTDGKALEAKYSAPSSVGL